MSSDFVQNYAYQNDIRCREKLNLVGNIKHALVFQYSHQAVLQRVIIQYSMLEVLVVTMKNRTNEIRVLQNLTQGTHLKELGACMSIHGTERVIK